MYFLDSVQFSTLSHFSPSSSSSPQFAKAIHSTWTHSPNSFTPFSKPCSFKAAGPKSSLLQREQISTPQSPQINTTASSPGVPPAPTFPFPLPGSASLPLQPRGAEQQLLLEKQHWRLGELPAAPLPGRALEGVGAGISLIWNWLWNATTFLDEQIAGNQQGKKIKKTQIHKTNRGGSQPWALLCFQQGDYLWVWGNCTWGV